MATIKQGLGYQKVTEASHLSETVNCSAEKFRTPSYGHVGLLRPKTCGCPPVNPGRKHDHSTRQS